MDRPDISKFGGSILDSIPTPKKPTQPVSREIESPFIRPVEDGELWLFDFHNTFVRGVIQSVGLNFKSLEGDKKAVSYFNVILHGRGDKAYPTGRDGKFIPPKGGDFRKFWLTTLGEEPYRWSLVCRYMKKEFDGLIFTGETENAIDSARNPYLRLKYLRLK